MKPVVSVIMPCYNAGRFIAEAINSVISQTFENWEINIVDDGSTDNSVEIIKSFMEKDQRIRLERLNQPSGSPAEPRNRAIAMARGEWIAFLDSDDVWLPTKLERQLGLAEVTQSPFIFSNYEKITAEGKRNNRIINAPRQISLKDLYYGNPLGCLTVMLNKSILDGFEFKKMGHEDCVAWIGILQNGYIAYNTNTVEAMYREGLGTVSSNKIKIMHWQWNIYRKIFKFGLFKSMYYYIHYAIRGFIKSRK